VDASASSALTRPGNVVFPANLPFLKDLTAAGGRIARQRSGHLVFYGPNNRRILATDPDGNPLHECEWGKAASGRTRLIRARIRLDWGQWVGLKPEGMVNTTTLDLSKKSGWQRLQADDLRKMAAEAMGVPFEEVKFFYGDEDLVIDSKGTATIRHTKDAFYVLDNGTFDRARFMACMGAMHWAAIDFLPVVELFQSLLPGTGSAAFELIRGLYDDQTEGQPLPLRYRGIPTYPSEAAYRLFSAFFTPQAPGGGNPLSIFMEAGRSHEVTWLPVPDPPRRHFDSARNLCVTIKNDIIQKVTFSNDQTGLPYVKAKDSGFAPYARSVEVSEGQIILRDDEKKIKIPADPKWGPLRDFSRNTSYLCLTTKEYPIGWRDFFENSLPAISPHDAFSSVLLYPEDETEIEESATQPFVADYLEDLEASSPELATRLAQAQDVLIDNFDAGLRSCIRLDHLRTYTVLYTRPAIAQKQAQTMWNSTAEYSTALDVAKKIKLQPAESYRKTAFSRTHDVIYEWMPFAIYDNAIKQHELVRAMTGAMRQGGLAFLVGPATLKSALQIQPQLQVISADPVEALPTFRMHQTILPKARLKTGLTLFHVAKGVTTHPLTVSA
jgi:hypothetical protein